ncbi:SRPBCC family protein [Streptomyces subrutilus]|uniref:SRPBCC family protein n=1 Tax=Streptomyces subrutilus TaxID=36818 RepID=A0A1E5PL88_9ACTN|nr:SRPBCC family protein [Streptomyces subrutilus]OEJ30213.1 hypothetical protein BGK67_01490 [Streptomyces subrutilus]
MSKTVSESIEIQAPPKAVYDAVTNVADMGRWSPECTGAAVESPAVRVGMRFTGHNNSAKGRPWNTNCTVTQADDARRFTFDVARIGLSIATWSYAFEPIGDGRATKVTETWTDSRGSIMHFIGPRVSGVHDRATHNRQTMKVTLQRLKEALESPGRSTA